MEQTPGAILKQYWGYTSFRPLQEEIITAALSGKDVLAILPTSAGKSICYQVPALALGGVCLVISPLIALMQDQVDHLQRRGIEAACIHSAMPKAAANDTLDKAITGVLKLLYVAPERLATEGFLTRLQDMDVRMVAIDEAHCISQWGHDFRPDYLNIAKIKAVLAKETPWMAMTATATPKVEQEILHYLNIPRAQVFRKNIYRPNLSYRVVETESKALEVVNLLQRVAGSNILYCPTRRKCMEMRHWLVSNGIKALAYHAGLDKEERFTIQKQWMQASDIVVCATTAFGMGIDKENVNQVIHLSSPDSLEAYYQEAGRAGRGGQPACCTLLYDAEDLLRLEELPSVRYPPKKFVLRVYQYVCDYLQIPVGAGREQSFSFDVIRFVHNFKLDLLPAMRAIRILEQSGVWVWQEHVLLSSTVHVLADEGDIQMLRKIKPALYQILTALLRLHSSIYSFPVALKIWEVADYLETEQSVISKGIEQLSSLGFLQYTPRQEGSFLFLQQPRSRPGDLTIDVKRIRRLKQALQVRIKEVLRYLEDDFTCRSLLLAQYFGERQTEACGCCDNCRHQAAPSGIELSRQIKQRLKECPESDWQALTSHFPDVSSELILLQVQQLQEEGFCRVLPNRTIVLL